MTLVSVTHTQRSDEELLGAARTDPYAFGLFYDRHFDALLAYFDRRTFDPHTAADLTAETFADALKHLRRYKASSGAPSAWLFGIARNHLRRHLRGRGIHSRALSRLSVLDLTAEDSSLEQIEASIDFAAQLPLLARGLDRLSPLLREAVMLRVGENMSFDELALALGCSQGTARQRVSRGLLQLQEALIEDTP